jgi:hypothetical protein
MSTTIVETWTGADLSQLGPIYPFVGTEVLLVIIGIAFWLGFHVLQAGVEREEFRKETQAAKTPERIQRVLEREGIVD